ncbi:MAG: polysaccharide biosynthesis tyrosine autokinase [Thiotrichaceae bacterium]
MSAKNTPLHVENSVGNSAENGIPENFTTLRPPQVATAPLNAIYPEELLEPSKGLNIREFWNVLVRHKKLLGTITALALLLSLIITLLMKPIYRASTTIQIERQSTAVADVVIEPTARRSERDYWQTQIQLLQSNTLANAVMDKLDIKDTFTSSKDGFLSSLRSAPPTPEVNFLKGLQVEPLNTSQLIMIHYESNDPELSSKIVNAIADTFIHTNLERQYKSTEYTQKFLQTQLDQAKERLSKSETVLNQFALDNKIIALDNNQTTSTHILTKLSDEFVDAERERIKLENELQQLTSAANSLDPSMILNTPHMRTLKKKLGQLEDSYASTKKRYGSKSRKARTAKKKVEYARGKIRSEAHVYKQSLDSRLAAAKLAEAGLEKRLNELQTTGLDAQSKVHTFNNLKREAHSNQTIYQSLLERIKEVGVASGIESNNITVIDKANIPYNKYKPKIKTNLIFGTLIGFLLGIAAIFLREFMDDSIKDADELERITKLPMLGMIPEYKGRSNTDIAQQIIKEPRSQISEAIRSLRTALSFSTQNGAPQTLFFTSSEPAEGKTTIALNLATAYALAGENVLLIDADLRNPSVHTLLKVDNRQGLSNYLTGSTDMPSSTKQTTISGLQVLPSGPLPPDPVELLSGRRIKELIEKASEQYDRIIIDGPPVLGLADALILANIADATLMTIHSETTLKAPVLASLKRLKQAKAYVLGTLMNKATPRGAAYSYFQYDQKSADQPSG